MSTQGEHAIHVMLNLSAACAGASMTMDMYMKYHATMAAMDMYHPTMEYGCYGCVSYNYGVCGALWLTANRPRPKPLCMASNAIFVATKLVRKH